MLPFVILKKCLDPLLVSPQALVSVPHLNVQVSLVSTFFLKILIKVRQWTLPRRYFCTFHEPCFVLFVKVTSGDVLEHSLAEVFRLFCTTLWSMLAAHYNALHFLSAFLLPHFWCLPLETLPTTKGWCVCRPLSISGIYAFQIGCGPCT